MIDEIEREIEEKYVRKFAFNDERQFIFYDDLLFLLDKYNNQPDYKSAWEELKNKTNEELKQATWSGAGLHDTKMSMQELEQKYNLGGE